MNKHKSKFVSWWKKVYGAHRSVFLFFIVFLLTAALAFLSYYFFYPRLQTRGFRPEIAISYDSEYYEDHGNICFGNIISCQDVVIYSAGTVDTKKLGDYYIDYEIRHGSQTFELSQKVSVVDDTQPIISVGVEKVMVCPNGRIPPFDLKVTDNYDGDITDKATITHHDNTVVITATDSNNNRAVTTISSVVEDDEAPVITFEKGEVASLNVGSNFEPPKVTVTDNCDENLEPTHTGEVDKNTVGSYVIKYEATDASGNIGKTNYTVKVIPANNGVIYLTFDDGPSEHTARLLDVLKKYNVKATFFVTGSGSDEIIRREYNEGHAIGLHTFSHNYSYIYQNMDNFYNDMTRVQNRVESITGYKSNLIRFPGGSSNTVSAKYDGHTRIMSRLVKDVVSKGFFYFDWNVSSNDAGGAKTAYEVYNNTISALKNNGVSVVLQHDTKGFSVDAVEAIIQYGLANGYTFRKLDQYAFGAHHGVNN
ncbi:polysaccharide deacetylase [Candidatus Saccharibacteria bacterium]|nr:polysaccharide deacetylase [Candidatus Saccharibacteria bacterium]